MDVELSWTETTDYFSISGAAIAVAPTTSSHEHLAERRHLVRGDRHRRLHRAGLPPGHERHLAVVVHGRQLCPRRPPEPEVHRVRREPRRPRQDDRAARRDLRELGMPPGAVAERVALHLRDGLHDGQDRPGGPVRGGELRPGQRGRAESDAVAGVGVRHRR